MDNFNEPWLDCSSDMYHGSKRVFRVFLLVIFTFMIGAFTPLDDATVVLPAHAHNDYLHERPLFEAIEFKFKSIEADVFSMGDSLFVAHGVREIRPGRTLRNLYLDPLRNIINRNGGSVYGEGSTLILFIDIKDDGMKTYRLLHEILAGYKEMLTVYESDRVKTGALTVIISGNRPLEFMRDQEVRYAGYDGRIHDLDSGLPSSLMVAVSDNWSRHFTWHGTGEMPVDEKKKLLTIVEKGHKEGYMLRFWSTPDKSGVEREAVWTVLKNARVDLIGTDDLKALQSWLTKR